MQMRVCVEHPPESGFSVVKTHPSGWEIRVRILHRANVSNVVLVLTKSNFVKGEPGFRYVALIKAITELHNRIVDGHAECELPPSRQFEGLGFRDFLGQHHDFGIRPRERIGIPNILGVF